MLGMGPRYLFSKGFVRLYLGHNGVENLIGSPGVLLAYLWQVRVLGLMA